jgi:hypothetical protein
MQITSEFFSSKKKFKKDISRCLFFMRDTSTAQRLIKSDEFYHCQDDNNQII